MGPAGAACRVAGVERATCVGRCARTLGDRHGHDETLSGLLGTFRYLEWLGVSQAGAPGTPGTPDGRPARFRAALGATREYERSLTLALVDGLATVPGLRIWGITDPARVDERCPTVGLTIDGHSPVEIATFLGSRAISTWDGDYYAYELIRTLGLAETGGMVRVGLVDYDTLDESDRLLGALREIAA